MKLIFILIFLNLFILKAHANEQSSHKLALIYRGPGTCAGCAEAVGSIFQKINYKFKYIHPDQMVDSVFEQASIYVQPGGSDNIEDTLKALSKENITSLKRFILSGGKYLGICAGAYLAGEYGDDDRTIKAYGFIPIPVIQEEIEDHKARLMPVIWLNERRSLYFQSGPSLGKYPIIGAEVIARYLGSGNIAALITPFGKGRVGLIGPHAEADQSWYKESHLPHQNKFNFDLIEDFILKL